jgi:TonB family protein
MPNMIVDQLDEAITRLLSGIPAPAPVDLQLREFTVIAAELRRLPRPDFRAQLKNDLAGWASLARVNPREPVVPASDSFTPRVRTRRTEFAPAFDLFSAPPMKRSHLALSFALHVALLAGLLSSGLWVARNPHFQRHVVSLLNDSPFLLAPSGREAHGGGGGGDQDRLSASKGTAPRFSSEQLTPPAAVVRNESPRLPAEPTVIGPPEILLPQSAQFGDPLAHLLAPPSNGTGSDGGVGSGSGGGVGSGYGRGVGPGWGGGIGGVVFHVGGGVTAPRPLFEPDPEYSEEARKAKYQGSVVLDVIVGPDGRPHNLRVLRSVGMGLDEKAIEAVQRWKFAPATKDGQPVAVRVSIEVAFRLY